MRADRLFCRISLTVLWANVSPASLSHKSNSICNGMMMKPRDDLWPTLIHNRQLRDWERTIIAEMLRAVINRNEIVVSRIGMLLFDNCYIIVVV